MAAEKRRRSCALESGLERRVQRRELQGSFRARAGRIIGALHLHHAFGERSGLIGAEHIHAPQILDCIETPHENAVVSIISAPRDKFTLRIAGRSSGLRPTASAIEKSSVSTGGRPRNTCDADRRSAGSGCAQGLKKETETALGGRSEHAAEGAAHAARDLARSLRKFLNRHI